ncbi:hypothetical protein K2173_027185 [Erythroxylum novogranatense]|uniref:Uncharacterized protein n=1 Tax=Erythroxylum novogranatense TaxID=1862640 RepID=A0AAV8U272_9ROSI|nr:hypothetical protein K2173_027185 [Erythroxylum novogranatense]
MGIPSFFKYLSKKYRCITIDVKEQPPQVVDGVSVPVDTSLPNPNGVEFDNLYLDMNGIIHPCFHPPQGLPAPTTYDEVFEAVFKYIDRIFSIVRPRKLIFMALDGVAPRAKMNQQRSRRFRAAHDALLEKEPNKLDSNVITPGTEFMDLLSSALRYYICLRMNRVLGWKGIKVILSDANVPGEGEHKIMSYIRLQRNLPGFDPNTHHCLYGMDADLILLGLATHEIHFTILREEVIRKDKSKQGSLKTRKIRVYWLKKTGKFRDIKNVDDYIMGQRFKFLSIKVLRKYLAHEMQIPSTKLKADPERLIDDFVFMCLFIGNDFLPNLPLLGIDQGALTLLMKVYKKEFIQMGGYLTNSFEINLTRVQHFLQAVGSHESSFLRTRIERRKNKHRKIRFASAKKPVSNASDSQFLYHNNTKTDGNYGSTLTLETSSLCQDSKNIRREEEDWKVRFYDTKFEAQTEDERHRIRSDAVFKFVEGICWVMRYYYEGVCSWKWFYPYHYAPFASDFHGIDNLDIHFTLGQPFKPFDQLMGVLPAASAHALPLFYRKLMTDPSSPILDFYPTEFELDMEGKRAPWQAVCKLPFVEETRLLSEIAKVEHTLTVEERQRNSFRMDTLFVHSSHRLAVTMTSFSEQNDHKELPGYETQKKIDPQISGGMNGYICVSVDPVQPGELYSPIDGMPMITNNQVLSVFYRYPQFHPHRPRLPAGVMLPHKHMNKSYNLPPRPFWHEKSVSRNVLPRPISQLATGSQLSKATQLYSKCGAIKDPGSSLGKKEGKVNPNKSGSDNDPHFATTFKSCISMELMGYQGDSAVAKGIKEMKLVKSNRHAVNAESKVKMLDSCIVMKQMEVGEDGENKKAVPTNNKKMKSGRSEKSNVEEVSYNVTQDSESCILEEHKTVDVNFVLLAEEGANLEGISNKRKQKSKKNQGYSDSIENSSAQVGNCVLMNSKCDVLHASVNNATITTTNQAILKESEHSTAEKSEIGSNEKQQEAEDDAIINVTMEMKTEVKSRKRKRKSEKKPNRAGSMDNISQDLGDCIFGEQNQADCNQAGDQAYANIALEMKSRERKQKPKKADIDPYNDAEKLDICNNVKKSERLVKEQQDADSVHTDAYQLKNVETEVKSNKRKQTSKNDNYVN